MVRKFVLYALCSQVAGSPLAEDDVNDLVFVADIFRLKGHEGVDRFAEEIGIALGVAPDAGYKVGDGVLMLQ